jgi:very-short-patch-repair endonuclease
MAYIGKTYPSTLHFNAPASIHDIAKNLRKVETEAEKLLWQAIRNRKCGGLKFRRQHPFKNVVLDFYCHEIGLAIEVDGGIHDNPEVKERDINRTSELENVGVKVIRFRNEEVFNNMDSVLKSIIDFAETCKTSSPRPSPKREGS